MSDDDHDMIIEMRTQMCQLCADMKELKSDVKVLKDEHHVLKERVLVNGLKIGGLITSLILLITLFGQSLKDFVVEMFV